MTHSLGTRGEKYSYPIGRVMRLVGAASRTPQVSRPESPGTKGTWKEKRWPPQRGGDCAAQHPNPQENPYDVSAPTSPPLPRGLAGHRC